MQHIALWGVVVYDLRRNRLESSSPDNTARAILPALRVL